MATTIAAVKGTGMAVVLNADQSFSLSDGRRLSPKVLAELRRKGLLDWSSERTRRLMEAYLDQVAPASAEHAGDRRERGFLHRLSPFRLSVFRTSRWALPLTAAAAVLLVSLLAGGGWYLAASGGRLPAYLSGPYYPGPPAGYVGAGKPPPAVDALARQLSIGGVVQTVTSVRVLSWDEYAALAFHDASTGDTVTGRQQSRALLKDSPDARYYAMELFYDPGPGLRRTLALVYVTPAGPVRQEAVPVGW